MSKMIKYRDFKRPFLPLTPGAKFDTESSKVEIVSGSMLELT